MIGSSTGPLTPSRVLIVDLPGPDLTPDQGRLLRQSGFGGVCLFARNFSTEKRTARLVSDIRDALGPHALIATDQEGGAVLRRLDVPMPPSPLALGVLDSEDAAREAGRIAARGLLDLGINWNFAPCLDVNVNTDNPVIGERSFGHDPETVARLGVAWALGSEEAGVMASVKHFPGHGDTSQDSHLTLPTVDKPRSELERTEWLPFRRAVQAGVGSVMTAHILYPALDPDAPATLSPAVLSGLLRLDWGYDGVIVTDATDMHAIADRYPAGAAAPLALSAGADAVLSCGHGDMETHTDHRQALLSALREGRLSEARVHEACARLDRAVNRFPGVPAPYTADQRSLDTAQVQRWAEQALTWVGIPPRLDPALPLLLIAPISAPVGGPYGDSLSGAHLATLLKEIYPHLHTVLHDDHDPTAALGLLDRFPGIPVLLATTGRWSLTELPRFLASRLREEQRSALHLVLWNADQAAELKLPSLISHGFRPANLQALAQALMALR